VKRKRKRKTAVRRLSWQRRKIKPVSICRLPIKEKKWGTTQGVPDKRNIFSTSRVGEGASFRGKTQYSKKRGWKVGGKGLLGTPVLEKKKKLVIDLRRWEEERQQILARQQLRSPNARSSSKYLKKRRKWSSRLSLNIKNGGGTFH